MLALAPFRTLCVLALLLLSGAAAAGFAGRAAARWGTGESALRGRSHCAACGHDPGPLELVPVLGYLLLRGRCRRCGCAIPKGRFAGELLLGAGFVLCALRFDITARLWPALFFLTTLLYISLTDLNARVIPDKAVIAACLFRLGWLFAFDLSPGALTGLVVDGLAASFPVLLLTLAAERLKKREMMGGGDIKLLFVMGIYLGGLKALLALLLACVFGIAAAARLRRRGVEEMPFGPFLAAGSAFSLIFGDAFISRFLPLFY